MEELKAKIAKMRAGINNPNITGQVLDSLKAALSKAEGQLAEMEKYSQPKASEKTVPVSPEKPPQNGRPKGVKNKAPRKSAPPLQGKPVDKNGHALQNGDRVLIEWDGKQYEGTVTAVQRLEGGSHSVKFTHQGKMKTMMRAAKYLEFVGNGTAIGSAPVVVIDHQQPMAADNVDKVVVAKQGDCGEAGTILVKPKKKTKIRLPDTADPAEGDMIEVHADGTPMAVITAAGMEHNFDVVGPAKVNIQPDGSAEFALPKPQKSKQEKKEPVTAILESGETPEQAAKERPSDDKSKYRHVKSERPSGKCAFTREEAKSPALLTFLKGRVMEWASEETTEAITGVLWIKSENKIVIRVQDKMFGALAAREYYTLCPETARTKRTDDPKKGQYTTLLGEDAMKELYRHPHGESCNRVAAALYRECYRNGACSAERQKRLYGIFATKCIRRNLQIVKERQKWLHSKTREKWDGYNGKKSYWEVYKEVAKSAKK